jgi:hypothetical protein
VDVTRLTFVGLATLTALTVAPPLRVLWAAPPAVSEVWGSETSTAI